jgi:DNA-binding MarR family transcriptional regulator
VDGLVQLSFVIQSLLGRVAAGHDLSITQLRLLGVLRDREIGMLELARILELEKSSVTGLVDRAERRDLVKRVAVPGNRRAVRGVLTPRGHALARADRGSRHPADRAGRRPERRPAATAGPAGRQHRLRRRGRPRDPALDFMP